MWRELDASCINDIVRLYRGEGDYDDSAGSGVSLQIFGQGAVPFASDRPYPGDGSPRQVLDFTGNVYPPNTFNNQLYSNNTSGLPLSNSSRTMMGWFKRTGDSYVPFGYGSTRHHSSFMPFLHANGEVHIVYGAIIDIPESHWYHVAYTFDKDDTKLSLYMNGNFNSSSGDVPNTDGGTIALGGTITLENESFIGYIADFAIFDRALSGDEIGAIYNAEGLQFGDDDGALCTVSEDSSLPDYKIAFPTCNVNSDIAATNSTVVITCQYGVTVPLEGSIESEILSAPNCAGGVDSVTYQPGELTNDRSGYEVTVVVSPNNADDANLVPFCLKTRVEDDKGNEMIYRSQIISIAFNYTAGFELNITASKFEGLNTTAEDLGTVDFEVEAHRCDSNAQEDTVNNALEIGDPLYVCIESKTDSIVVNEITDFTFKKDGNTIYSAVEGGIKDSNTYFKGETTRTMLVAHRARAAMFTDNGVITIEGSVLLGASEDRRYLARFVQEVANGAVTNSNFEVEVEVIKADSAANIAGNNICTPLIGTIIGFVFMWNLYV